MLPTVPQDYLFAMIIVNLKLLSETFFENFWYNFQKWSKRKPNWEFILGISDFTNKKRLLFIFTIYSNNETLTNWSIHYTVHLLPHKSNCSQCILSLPSENIRKLYSFLIFSEIKKGCIDNKWVKRDKNILKIKFTIKLIKLKVLRTLQRNDSIFTNSLIQAFGK